MTGDRACPRDGQPAWPGLPSLRPGLHQLRPRLNGLTDDEYFWQPVPGCWTVSHRGQSTAPVSFGDGEFTMDYAMPPRDPEPVTTIAWRLAHLIVVFASTSASHFGAPAAHHETFRYSGTSDGALRHLDDAHDTYVSGGSGPGRRREDLSRQLLSQDADSLPTVSAIAQAGSQRQPSLSSQTIASPSPATPCIPWSELRQYSPGS
jgi:hypothetical protein